MQQDSTDCRLTEISKQWDLLKHPFYRRWVAGELSKAELMYYAGQYSHVVKAIPRWLAAAADKDFKNAEQLRPHIAEESDHIALWENFATALGIDPDSLHGMAPNSATAAMIAQGDELAAAGHGVAVVWSIEAQSPAVSAEKLRGLQKYYGIDAKSGGEYFALHETRDVEHEVQLRDVINSQDTLCRGGAYAAASATLARMWDLLSSVQAA